MLVGLASCLTAGVAAVAQNRGIQLDSVKATVEGDMNILGILGADPEVRNGFSDIRVNFEIDADADADEIAALVAQSQKRSAVFDALTNPTNVTVTVSLSAPASLRIPVVIVGAGHAGLAVSRVLSEQSIEHVVLERGEVANTWRTERWDSLRLLTPNWLTRLPGLAYDGEDPDGFMAVAELVEFIERYADHVDAPVRTQHHRHLGVAPARRRLPASRPTPGAGRRTRSSWPAARSTTRGCRRCRRRCRPRSTRSPRSTTSVPTSCGPAGCSSSAPRPPASSSPTSCCAPDAR